MSLTATLLFGTGLLHNMMGLASPRLREPLWRMVADGGTVVTADTTERYAREDAFWFQFAGIALMIHGWHARHLVRQMQSNNDNDDFDDESTSPAWLAWAVLISGTVGAYCKPVSGFHVLYLQGIRLLWIQYYRSSNNNHQKPKLP